MARRAVLQLIRLPNCFTAVPDVWAGWFCARVLVTGSPEAAIAGDAPVALSATGLVGFLAYAGGVAMNDLVDLGHDRKERPERPIPSGRLSLATGWAISLGSLAVAATLVTLVAPTALVVFGSLIAAIVAYNLLHKRVPALGLPLMGLARACNVLTGFAIGGLLPTDLAVHHPAVLIYPALLWLYVLSISVVARLEKRFELAVKAVPRMILGIALVNAVATFAITGCLIGTLAVAVWIVPAALFARRFAMS